MERYLFEFVLLVAVLAAPSNQFLPPPRPPPRPLPITTPILPSTAIAPTVTATTGNVPSTVQQQQKSQNVVQTLSSQLQQPMTSQNQMTVFQSQVISTSSTIQYNLKTILFPNATPVQIPTLLPKLMCRARRDRQWGFIWPNTPAGKRAQIPCPSEFRGHARRRCSVVGIWLKPNLKNCVAIKIKGITDQANTFFNGNRQGNDSFGGEPDLDGALFLVNQLSNLTMPHNGMTLPPSDLNTLNFVVGQTLPLLKEEGGPGGNQGQDIIDVMNNALSPNNEAGWSELQQSQSGSEELLSNAESYALYLASTINDTNETAVFSRENFAIRARWFSAEKRNFENSRFPSKSDLVNSSNTDTNNSIVIPAAYLEAKANEGDVSVVHMLFPSLQDFLPSADNDSIPASVIISSQVIASANTNVSAEQVLLESPIELTFSLNVSYNSSSKRLVPRCVYWNFTSDFNSTSYGRWVSDDTIKVDALINDTTVRCLSYHLTSFAVLVSVVDLDESVPIDDNNATNQTNETTPTIISLEDNVLSIVSYVGCSISIVCLMATVVCLLTLKKELFEKPFNFIHLNLAVALMLALIVFVAGTETATSIPELCMTITVVLHYLFLSVFSWMLCEGIMLYLLIVVVFSQVAEKLWIYFILGWGLPIIPVGITLGIRFNHYTSNSLCWLNTDYGVIWGFVGPMLGIICVNTVILVIVLIKTGQSRYGRWKRQTITKRPIANFEKKIEDGQKTLIDIVKGMVVLLPLLGVTWIIGIFAVNSSTSIFAWLFVILNSLQGAFIFFFHVVKTPLIWGRIKKWHKQRKRIQKSSIRYSTAGSRNLSAVKSTSEFEISKDEDSHV